MLLFGSSCWSEVPRELEVYFGGMEIVFFDIEPWSEITFMQYGQQELKPGDNSQAKLLDSADIASEITEIWRIS